MKTSELAGALLAEWVARALGYAGADSVPSDLCGRFQVDDDSFRKDWEPHEDWAQGGPIIERELISLGWSDDWLATGRTGISIWGETALIAAMRAHAATTFGHILADDILHLMQEIPVDSKKPTA